MAGTPARYTAASDRLRPAPHRVGTVGGLRRPDRRPALHPRPGRDSCPARPGAGIVRAALLLPARIRHGRPLRLLPRAIIAAVLSLLVLHLVPGQPSGPAVVTGLITWFVLTARGDLAPPPGR